MTIDIKQLESLLERVTPGEWSNDCYASDAGWGLTYDSDSEAAKNGGCMSRAVEGGGSPIAIVMVPAPWGNDVMGDVCDANAELMAMSKALARRVIAAEKLVNAVRDYRAKPETHIEEHVRTGLSYPEINAARMERSIKLANAVDEALSEWENMK